MENLQMANGLPLPLKKNTFFPYLLSVLGHPLFLPTLVVWYMVAVHPQVFVGYNPFKKFQVLGSTALNTIIFPVVLMLLLKAMGFVKTFLLHDKRERMIVCVASMLFYFWIHYVFRNQDHPRILPQYFMGVFLCLPSALMAGIYFKISWHALAWGNTLGFLTFLAFAYTANMAPALCLFYLAGGLVLSSRLWLHHHKLNQIVWGFAIGVLCSVAAYYFYN
jgi:hypothetical protein